MGRYISFGMMEKERSNKVFPIIPRFQYSKVCVVQTFHFLFKAMEFFSGIYKIFSYLCGER